GKATVTFNDDSTGEVQGNVVAKKDAEKYTPNVPTTKVPVGDVNNLTDEEKGQVKTNVENANPDLPSGAEVTIGNDGTATIKYSDNSTDTIAGNKLVVAKPDTSTEQKVNLPGSKIEVSDPNHLTDEEKQQVKDNVAKSNPDAKDIKVGDNGDTDVIFNNGNYGHVSGDQLVVKSNDSHDNTTDADKHPAVVPGTKVEVADPSHLTDEEKQQVKDNVAKSNPDAKDIKVSDNGDTTLIYNDGSQHNLSGSDLIIKKDNNSSNTSNNTDADNNPAVIPDTKTPVQDPNHLTDAEKSQIKDNVSKSNPNAKDILVGNNADTTLIYGDGSKNVIKGTDLIVVKLTSTISPSKNTSGLQGKDKNTSNKNEVSSKQTLPQTGESDNVLAVISGAVVTILSIVTLGLIKRRKE
ncbi:LPXTG cell wall anchor domain-containing protein, partial [Lactobacillus johnsonii]|uniref:LPXTG cell wall anchor domain-containing protein n=1 Tax=Lactobacillus johnsonii TaxID=33959 RepID=UPI003F1F1C1F